MRVYRIIPPPTQGEVGPEDIYRERDVYIHIYIYICIYIYIYMHCNSNNDNKHNNNNNNDTTTNNNDNGPLYGELRVSQGRGFEHRST